MEIPNSLSPDELKSLLADAKSDDEAKVVGPYGGHSREAMEHIVEEHCEALMEKVRTPMADKLAMVFRLQRFIGWHEEVALMHAREGAEAKEQDQINCGLGWASDLGKLKVALEIICDINLGKDDYLANDICDTCGEVDCDNPDHQ